MQLLASSWVGGNEITEREVKSLLSSGETNYVRRLETITGDINTIIDNNKVIDAEEVRERSAHCDHAHQFENLFLNKAGLKMANIFGTFRLTPPRSVLDIGGGPGGFATFIRELTQAQCYYLGITLDQSVFRWSPTLMNFVDGRYHDILLEKLDFHRKFEHIYADLGAVNDSFQSADGVKDLLKAADDLMHRHIEDGGLYICKIFDITTIRTITYVLNVGRYFRQWTVFKPFTSRATNGEVYFIGTGYGAPSSSSASSLPDAFVEGVLTVGESRVKALREFGNNSIPVYDTSALPIYWHFP